MIRDQELLHGAALLRLIDSGVPVSICNATSIHPSAYVVEAEGRQTTLLLKLSTRKKSPWQFTFTEIEGAALAVLAKSYPHHERLLVFVCHLDGVCCLPHGPPGGTRRGSVGPCGPGGLGGEGGRTELPRHGAGPASDARHRARERLATHRT